MPAPPRKLPCYECEKGVLFCLGLKSPQLFGRWHKKQYQDAVIQREEWTQPTLTVTRDSRVTISVTQLISKMTLIELP